jgi:hypothetical protein
MSGSLETLPKLRRVAVRSPGILPRGAKDAFDLSDVGFNLRARLPKPPQLRPVRAAAVPKVLVVLPN